MKKIIYSKFSNDRSYNYKIKTDILEDEQGNRYVTKSGLTDESKEHIRFMYEMAKVLEVQLKNSKFELNRCAFMDDVLGLEYINGKGLDEVLDSYIKEDRIDLFKETVKIYAHEIRKLATEDFIPSAEYRVVFGKGAYDSSHCKSMKISNIDMIFANINIYENRWTVLDYEWCFPFSVPVDFVLYRTIHYYLTPDREHLLKDIDLYDIFELDKSLEKTWYIMEQNFQSYVYDDNAPLWKLYKDMKKKSFFPQKWIVQNSIMHQISVAIYKGEEFSIKNIDAVPDDNGNVSFVLDIEEYVNTVILSVAACPCIVEVYGVKSEKNNDVEITYGSNGSSYNNKLICFDTSTPQILIDDIPEQVTDIRIEFNISYIDSNIAGAIKQLMELYNQERFTGVERVVAIQELEARVREQDDKLGELRTEILHRDKMLEGIYNSSSWKITKPLRWTKGKIRRNNEIK